MKNDLSEGHMNYTSIFSLAFLLIAPMAGAATNLTLFSEVAITPSLQKDAARLDKNPTIARHMYVKVNLDVLAQLEVLAQDEPVVLNLFEKQSLQARKERVEKRSAKSFTWFGRIDGKPESSVILTVENGVLFGSLSLKGKFYQLRHTQEDIYSLREINQSAMPKDAPPIIVPGPKNAKPRSSSSLSTPKMTPIIDVMVLYTQEARQDAERDGGIRPLVQQAIDQANQIYKNSRIDQELRLAYTEEVKFGELCSIPGADQGKCLENILEKIKNNSFKKLTDIQKLRKDKKADIVSLWVEDGGAYCGIAYQPSAPITKTDEKWAFNVVVERDCALGDYAFAHELGHNMGAAHNREHAASPGAYSYSYGYRKNGSFRTVMSDDDGCNCSHILYFSNPKVTYGDSPTGVEDGQSDAADNAKTLNNAAMEIANFR